MSLRSGLLLSISLFVCLWSGLARANPPADQPQTSLSHPGTELTVQTGHAAEIHAVQYASNGKFFVTAGKDSTIKLWSPEGTLIRTIRTGFWVNYLALSHDSQLLLAASRLCNVFLLSLDGRVLHKFPDVPMKEGF